MTTAGQCPDYDAIQARHLGQFVADPALRVPWFDRRQCLALVWVLKPHPGILTFELEDACARVQQILSPSDALHFSLRPTYRQGQVHVTCMQLVSFDHYHSRIMDQFPAERLRQCVAAWLREMRFSPLFILDRWLALRTGLVLAGGPTEQVNELRSRIRTRFSRVLEEPVPANDMVHATLARFVSPEAMHGRELLNSLPHPVRVPIQVRDLRLCICSYSMQEGTYETIWSLDAQTSVPIPRMIAHRGFWNGADADQELSNFVPSLIARTKLTDVECDLWVMVHPKTGELVWCMQHERPTPDEVIALARSPFPRQVRDWIERDGAPGAWVHAKNALAAMQLRKTRAHWFAHDMDPFVVTSRGIPWAFPEQGISGAVWVTNTLSNVDEIFRRGVATPPFPAALCTDWPLRLLETFLGRARERASV